MNPIQRMTAFIMAVLFIVIGINAINSTSAQKPTGYSTIQVPITKTVYNTTSATIADAVATNTGPPNISINPQSDSIYLRRDAAANSVCEKINSTNSAIVTPISGNVTVQLAKTNNPLGNVTVAELNNAGATVHSFGSLNASKLTTSLTNYQFNSSTYTPSSSDQICTTYVPPTPTTPSQTLYYNQANQTTSVAAFFTSTTILGEQVVDTSSILYNKTINFMSVDLKKTGTPPGIFTVGVFDNSGNLVYTLGNMSASALTTSQASYTFFNSHASHVMAVNDRIGFQYNDPNSNTNNKVFIFMATYGSSGASYDGAHSQKSRYQAGYFGDNVSDITAKIGFQNTPSAASQFALMLDGLTQYVSLPSASIIKNGTNALSGCALIWPTGYKSSANEVLFGNLKSSINAGIEWILDPDGQSRLIFQDNRTNTQDSQIMKLYVSPGQWHNLCFTYAGAVSAGRNVTFFLDDQAYQSKVFSNNTAIKINNVDNYDLGWRSSGTVGSNGETFQGKLDRFRLWNTTLTPTQIYSYMNGGDILTNQLISMDFDMGQNQNSIDKSGHNYDGQLINEVGNNMWVAASDPNWVLVGIDQAELPSFDLTDMFSFDSKMDRSIWLIDFKDNPNTLLTTQTLDLFKSRGFKTILFHGVDQNWNPSVAPYSTAAAWIAQAKSSPYNFNVQGVILMDNSTVAQDGQYCNSTYADQTKLQTRLGTIINASKSSFSSYAFDIECDELSTYSSQKSALLNYYITNVSSWMTTKAHSLGKTIWDWANPSLRNDYVVTAGIAGGITASHTDGTYIGTYFGSVTNASPVNGNGYTNKTATTLFSTILNDDSSHHRIIQTINLRQQQPTGVPLNSQSMEKAELPLQIQTIANLNSTHNEVIGISMYFYGYENSYLQNATNPLLTGVIDKTPIVNTKYSYGETYDGTNYSKDLTGFDLYASIPTIAPQARVNSTHIKNGITGTADYWESRNPTGDYAYVDLGSPIRVHDVTICDEYGHIPTQVSLYVSNSTISWGSPINTYNPSQSTITYSPTLTTVCDTRQLFSDNLHPIVGQYLRINPDSSSSPSFRISEVTAVKQNVYYNVFDHYETQAAPGDSTNSDTAVTTARSTAYSVLGVMVFPAAISLLFAFVPVSRMREMMGFDDQKY